jgi:hypothetical protein
MSSSFFLAVERYAERDIPASAKGATSVATI